MANVILMEDSVSLRRILIRYLRDADHTVTAFENGASSKDADLLDQADVLVTDLSMPDIDGWQVLRNAHLIAPDLPVIVMTGEDRIDHPLLDGAFAYLNKPFEEEEFLEVVERAASTRVRCTDDNESINESYIANAQVFGASDAAAMAAPMAFCGPAPKPSLYARLSQGFMRLLGRTAKPIRPKGAARKFIENAPETSSRDDDPLR